MSSYIQQSMMRNPGQKLDIPKKDDFQTAMHTHGFHAGSVQKHKLSSRDWDLSVGPHESGE